jgi:hypothetical protein
MSAFGESGHDSEGPQCPLLTQSRHLSSGASCVWSFSWRAFFHRWLGGRKFEDYLARYRVGEPEPAALVFEMLTESVENTDHEGPRVNDLLEACPFADQAERVFAGFDQRSAAEALEAGIFYAADCAMNCS